MSNLVDPINGITLIQGEPNPPSSPTAQAVRRVIGDTMGGGRSGWDLQCTEYGHYRVKTVLGIDIDWSKKGNMSRNGGNWDDIFIQTGQYKVLSKPMKHCTFHSPPVNGLPTGHVGFVEEVNADGTIKISECNFPGQGRYNERVVPEAKYKTWSFVQYKDAPSITPPIPEWAADVVAKCKAKGIKTDLTKSAGDIPLYHLLKLISKFLS